MNVNVSTTKAAQGIPVRSIVFLAISAFASQAMVRCSDSILPQMAVAFGVTVGAASIVVSAYGFAHGTSQLFIGPIGDKLGKYRATAIMCGLASVFVFICGLMPTLGSLAIARFLSGAAAGWIIPLGMAYVGDVTPYEKRQPVLGRYLTGQISGLLFGQVAGGVLGDWFGWRAVFFLLSGLLALATLGIVYEYVTNPRTHTATRPEETSRGFVVDYVTVLSNPWARKVVLAIAIEGFVFWGTFAYIGADLHLRSGFSFSMVGLTVAAFAIGGLAYVFTVQQLVRRLGQRGLTVIGGLIIAVAFLLLAGAFADWIAPLAIAATGLGFYMLHNTLQTNATQMTPEARGTAVAIFSSALYLSQAAGVAVAAPFVDRLTAAPLLVAAAVIAPLLGIWFAYELKRRERLSANVD